MAGSCVHLVAGRDHVANNRSETVVAEIDGDAARADRDALYQELDDPGLLGRKQRCPELVEASERGDDRPFVDRSIFRPQGLDGPRRDLRCADHPPDFADDGGLDHACRKALRAGVFACRPIPDQVHRRVVAIEPAALLRRGRRHGGAGLGKDYPLQKRRCLRPGVPAEAGASSPLSFRAAKAPAGDTGQRNGA